MNALLACGAIEQDERQYPAERQPAHRDRHTGRQPVAHAALRQAMANNHHGHRHPEADRSQRSTDAAVRHHQPVKYGCRQREARRPEKDPAHADAEECQPGRQRRALAKSARENRVEAARRTRRGTGGGRSSSTPCSIPQTTNVQLAPCQRPPSVIVISRLRSVCQRCPGCRPAG